MSQVQGMRGRIWIVSTDGTDSPVTLTRNTYLKGETGDNEYLSPLVWAVSTVVL